MNVDKWQSLQMDNRDYYVLQQSPKLKKMFLSTMKCYITNSLLASKYAYGTVLTQVILFSVPFLQLSENMRCLWYWNDSHDFSMYVPASISQNMHQCYKTSAHKLTLKKYTISIRIKNWSSTARFKMMRVAKPENGIPVQAGLEGYGFTLHSAMFC